jgi:5'-3' exonuclease
MLLIDADSLLYKSVYNVENLQEAIDNFENKVLNIRVLAGYFEKYQTIIKVNSDNFRYQIDSTYKANRKKEKPSLFYSLRDYVANSEHTRIVDNNLESDDIIANEAQGNIIAYIDKDLTTVYTADLHINYNTLTEYSITKEQAFYNFYTQMIEGDAGDNIKGVNKCGKKFAKKFLDALSPNEYFKNTLKLYEKTHSIQTFIKTYQLLRLGNLSFIYSPSDVCSIDIREWNDSDWLSCLS